MTQEDRNTRLKRLKIRSWRRGTKEMDLILGGWSDVHLPDLDAETLDRYEALLEENDQDIYRWISTQEDPPTAVADLIDRIRRETTPAAGKTQSY